MQSKTATSTLHHPFIFIAIITILSIFRTSHKFVNGFTTVRSLKKSRSLSSTNTILALYRDSSSQHTKSQIRTLSSLLERSNSSNSDDTSINSIEAEGFDRLTVVQIKEILRGEGLKVTGRKVELIERLLEHRGVRGQRKEKEDKVKEVKLVVEEPFTDTMPRQSTKKRNTEKTKDEDEGKAQSKGTNVPKATKEAEPKGKKAKVDHQRITDRDELRKLWNAEEALQKGSYSKYDRSKILLL